MNEPQNDTFEDMFFEYLANFDYFTDKEIKEACIAIHNHLGGEEGDESIDYCKMLVKENSEIIRNDNVYMWKAK